MTDASLMLHLVDLRIFVLLVQSQIDQILGQHDMFLEAGEPNTPLHL
jgi:hypothetical protein